MVVAFGLDSYTLKPSMLPETKFFSIIALSKETRHSLEEEYHFMQLVNLHSIYTKMVSVLETVISISTELVWDRLLISQPGIPH